MSEFRQNPITKNWVLIAPSKGKKPAQFKTYSVMHGVADVDSTCIFCPQNAEQNPEVIQYGKNDSLDSRVGVLPSKFSSLDVTTAYRHKEFFISHSSDGDNEVIFTRLHNEPVALQSIALVESTLKVFIERVKSLAQRPSLAHIQIFHNYGRDAGASTIHPHYQIVALPIVPPEVHSEMLGAYHYYQNHQSCIYCDIIKEELGVKDRVVCESDYFVAICPYSSMAPFETWIMPKRHSGRFENMTEKETGDLAFILKVILGQIYAKLSDPPLNFFISTMPIKNKEAGQDHSGYSEQSSHWRLVILPRVTIWAGFEFATGIPVNPIAPEGAAKFLKGV